MKKLKANLYSWFLGVLTLVYLIYGWMYLDAQRFVSVGNIILFVLLIAVLALFLRKCLIWYSAFMLVGKKPFIKEVDRPRVFFFTFFYGLLLLFYLVFHQYLMIPLENNVTKNQMSEGRIEATIMITISVFIFALLIFTFSKKFEKIYLPKFKKTSQNLEGSKVSVKKVMKKERVEEILENLKEQGFLFLEDDKEKEEKQKNELIRLLTSNRRKSKTTRMSEIQNKKIADDIPRNPVLRLNMKNAELKIFFKNLRKETNLFHYYELAEIFGNENGRAFNYNSLSTTAGGSKESGTYDLYEEKILEVFKENS